MLYGFRVYVFDLANGIVEVQRFRAAVIRNAIDGTVLVSLLGVVRVSTNRTGNTVLSPLAKTRDLTSSRRGCDLVAKIEPCQTRPPRSEVHGHL